MSMRLRYRDIMNSRIPAKVGACSDSTELMQWCSDFQERASNYGRWWGSTQIAQFCVTQSGCGGACIVLPREVAEIEAANLNGVPMNVQNMWGQFDRPHLSFNQSSNSGAPNCSGGATGWRCGCGCGCAGVPQMEDEGCVPSFSVTAAGQKIRLYPASSADVGKFVVIQGNDSNGIWVRTEFANGSIQDGEQVALTLPFAETATTWGAGAPMALYKDVTTYRVLMFAVEDEDTDALRQLAEYEPSETNPTYRKKRIPGLRANCGTGCGNRSTLRCVVSLQHVPITGPDDWLLFANLPAYSDGILAEKYYENGDGAAADAYFFGNPRPARNARGVLRVAVGQGALGQLESELRKQTGDKSTVRVQRDGLSLIGFV